MASGSPSDAVRYDDVEDIVMTGEAVGLELRPTGFALAAAGAAIDFVIYLFGGLILTVFAVILPLSTTSWGRDDAVVSTALSTCLVLFLVVIPTAVEWMTRGKSVGRLAVGARIVREDGGSIGFRQAFIRSIVGLFEIYLTVGAVAALFGLLNDKSKRMGDFLAGTYSQYERVSAIPQPLYGVPVQLTEWARTADVARMPNRLFHRLSTFLRHASGLTPSTREHMATELAAEASAWVSPVPPVHPELFIAGIVALRREREFRGYALQRKRLDALGPALTGQPHGFPDRD
jgi:uncharacterized RDD family membrane protein YckC